MKKTQQSLELEVKGRREAQVSMKSEIDHFQLMLEALPQIAFTLNEATPKIYLMIINIWV